MLETRKVDNNRKDTQSAFRKPTSIMRNKYALLKSGCVVLFIVQW